MTEQERIGADRWVAPAEIPSATETEVVQLNTSDGATVTGVLRTVPGATIVSTLVHPRQDFTHHVLVPELLERGCAVWTQCTRSPNNDLALTHEQALLDVAAGYGFLRSRGFEQIVAVGHSGGGPLAAFYLEQAATAPEKRLTKTPSGKPVELGSVDMPLPSGLVLVAPHPGQAVILSRMIDPAVTDERDPLSVDPDLDLYDSRNGFVTPPESSSYSAEFVTRYRRAQEERIKRIDAVALAMANESSLARARYEESKSARDRQAAIAPQLLTVYRTDADPRCVDLSLDVNARPYGSVFGRRPDLTNFGLVGFGRLSTADAWLSTWSVNTSMATFARCAPQIRVPTLFVTLTGDQASFPSDVDVMTEALGTTDRTSVAVEGTHFLGAVKRGAPEVAGTVGEIIGAWLGARFEI